jgi:hypothetical protein
VVLNLKFSSFINLQYGLSLVNDYSARFYKQQQFVETLQHEDLLRLIAEWIEQLDENSTLLTDEQYATHFSAFKNNIPLIQKQNIKDFIKRCDAYYEFFVLSLQNEFRIQTQHKPLSLPNLKYVDLKASGVFLKAFYSENETIQRELGPLLESGLAIKNSKQKHEVALSR